MFFQLIFIQSKLPQFADYLSIQVQSSGGGANLQSRNVNLTSTSSQTFYPSSGYEGLSSISVTPNLQNKTIYPSTSSQIVVPDGGYCGLKQVTVSKISDYYRNFTLSVHASANSGTYEYSNKTAFTYWPHTYTYNLSLENLPVDISQLKKVYAHVSLMGSDYYSDEASTSEIEYIWTNHSLNSISIRDPTASVDILVQIL